MLHRFDRQHTAVLGAAGNFRRWGLARRMEIILGEGAGFGGDAGAMAPSCFSLL